MRIALELGLSVLLVAGCAPDRPPAPYRSPTTDYPLPPAQTSDGEVVGADRVPPDDKIRQGPAVGGGGARPSEGPGGGGPEAERGGKPNLWPCQPVEAADAGAGATPRPGRNPCAPP